MVDDTPIRIYRNNEDLGVPFPDHQAMSVFASLWNGEEWATQNGAIKLNWSNAPFVRFCILPSAFCLSFYFEIGSIAGSFCKLSFSQRASYGIEADNTLNGLSVNVFINHLRWNFATPSLMSCAFYR